MLGLGIDAHRLVARSVHLGEQGQDFLEGRDFEPPVIVGTAQPRQPLARAQRLQFGEREILGEPRSEEHTSELQSLMRISYAVFVLNKKNKQINTHNNTLQL